MSKSACCLHIRVICITANIRIIFIVIFSAEAQKTEPSRALELLRIYGIAD
jgi:hypothetical protein